MSYIISAFPGCGKSYYSNTSNKLEGLKVSDSDSSMFSWVLDEEGKSTGVRNPEFPANYMAHIKQLIDDEYDIIFVSTHQEVRDALTEAGLKYILVYPLVDAKETFMGYYKQRKSPDKFIELMDNKWDMFVGTCEQTETGSNVFKWTIKDHKGFEDMLNVVLDNTMVCDMHGFKN